MKTFNLIITILFLTAFSYAQTVFAPQMTAAQNSTTIASFDITNAKELISFQFDITYNPAALTPTECTIGDLAYPMEVVCNLTEPGIIRMASYGSDSFSGDGTILNVAFDTYTGTSQLKISSLYLFDQGGWVPSKSVNGRITLE